MISAVDYSLFEKASLRFPAVFRTNPRSRIAIPPAAIGNASMPVRTNVGGVPGGVGGGTTNAGAPLAAAAALELELELLLLLITIGPRPVSAPVGTGTIGFWPRIGVNGFSPGKRGVPMPVPVIAIVSVSVSETVPPAARVAVAVTVFVSVLPALPVNSMLN